MAWADVVTKLAEQLEQVQSQLAAQQSTISEQQAINAEQQAINAEQQAINAEQARQIDALTRNDVKQDQQFGNMTETITEQVRQVYRLTDNVARLEAEHKFIAALQENGTGFCAPPKEKFLPAPMVSAWIRRSHIFTQLYD